MVVGVFVISRLHEIGVHFADRHFNRNVARAGKDIDAALLKAGQPQDVEAILVEQPRALLDLASASLFRKEESLLRRCAAQGWEEGDAETLDIADPMLAPLPSGKAFGIDAESAKRNRLPAGRAQPILAVPIADRFHSFALALYGEHVNGTDLTHDERALLARIADTATAVLAKLENEALRSRVSELEQKLEKAIASRGLVSGLEAKPHA
jgi:hypothetical protein